MKSRVGRTVKVHGTEYVVVWSGGEGLVPDRETKVTDAWVAPSRIYNKTGKHSKKNKGATPVVEGAQDEQG